MDIKRFMGALWIIFLIGLAFNVGGWWLILIIPALVLAVGFFVLQSIVLHLLENVDRYPVIVTAAQRVGFNLHRLAERYAAKQAAKSPVRKKIELGLDIVSALAIVWFGLAFFMAESVATGYLEKTLEDCPTNMARFAPDASLQARKNVCDCAVKTLIKNANRFEIALSISSLQHIDPAFNRERSLKAGRECRHHLQ